MEVFGYKMLVSSGEQKPVVECNGLRAVTVTVIAFLLTVSGEARQSEIGKRPTFALA